MVRTRSTASHYPIMSEMHDIIADVVADRQSATTNPVKNLRTGVIFHAEIEGNIDPLRLVTELGEDIREAAILHVDDNDEAAGILAQDIVEFTLFGSTDKYRVIKRVDGPTPCTDFWVQIIADKDS